MNYESAIKFFNSGMYIEAVDAFTLLKGYKDSKEFLKKSKDAVYDGLIENYNKNLFLKNLKTREEIFEDFRNPFVQTCIKKYKIEDFKKIKETFKGYENYKQSAEYIEYCDQAEELYLKYEEQKKSYALYQKAIDLFNSKRYSNALAIFTELKENEVVDFNLAGKNIKTSVGENDMIKSFDNIEDSEDYIDKCKKSIYQEAVIKYHQADLVTAKFDFNEILDYKDSRRYIDLIEIKIAEKERKERKQEKIERIFHFVIWSSPIILSIIFGLILFCNKEQISIASSFGGWCFGWVVFTLISIVFFIRFFIKEMIINPFTDEMRIRKISGIVAAVSVICLIITVSCAAQLTPGFDPTGCVTLEATAKNDSISGSRCDSVVTFNLENESKYTVTYILGEMKFYNGEDEIVTYNVYFRGTYKGGQSYLTTVEFSSYDPSLYSVPFENLKITYRITSMMFENDRSEREYDGETVVIKDV